MKSNAGSPTQKDPKLRKHKLSRFLCQEMLYDYVMDKLDPNRKESVRDSLANDEHIREALENLREGLSYSHKLKGVTPSRPLVEKLLVAETPSRRLTKKLSFKELPATLRLALEALGVSLTVAIVVIFLPWNQMRRFLLKENTQSVEIARVDGSHHGVNGDVNDATPDSANSDASGNENSAISQTANAQTAKNSTAGSGLADSGRL